MKILSKSCWICPWNFSQLFLPFWLWYPFSHWCPYCRGYIKVIVGPICYSATISPFYLWHYLPFLPKTSHCPGWSVSTWMTYQTSYFLNLLNLIDLISIPVIHSSAYTKDHVKTSEALQASLYNLIFFHTQPLFLSLCAFISLGHSLTQPLSPAVNPPTCHQSFKSSLRNLWPLPSHMP